MAFSRLIDAIEGGTGKFDLNKSYYINNVTDEDIVVQWGAKEPEARGAGTYVIKAGEMGGPYPQFLAYHIVKALVSREMQKDGNTRYFGNAEMRAPYEDKYLKEAGPDAEDSLTASIRAQEHAKLLAAMKSEPIVDSVGVTSSETRRLAIEESEKPKRGRPRKDDTEEFAGANR